MQIKNKHLSNVVHFIHHYFGWRNWSVFVYNSIFENTFVFFYIALRRELYSLQFTVDFFLFLLFSAFCTTYGYLINDFSDRELDKLHGKDNTFKDDSTRKAGVIVCAFLLLSIVAGLRFMRNPLFGPIWFCWIGIATAYSIKPFRLKEQGKVGLFFVVIAQRALPTLLIFLALQYDTWMDIILLTTYVFFRGLSSDLAHQLEDYQKDLGTATDTYAVQAGLQKAQKIFRFSLEMEKALLVLCLFLMYVKLSHLQIDRISLLLPLLLGYLILYGMNWVKILSQHGNIDMNPFIPGRKDIFQFIHHAFPSVVVSFYLLLILVFKGWPFIIILCFFIVFRKIYSLALIRNSFPVRAILSRKWR